MELGSKVYAAGQTARCFQASAVYAGIVSPHTRTVHDGAGRDRTLPPTERHLQCAWLDPRWRPPTLVTATGEQVRVVQPGIWNLEAGPDFLGATLEVEPDHRLVCGDVELHVRPSGWKQHSHHLDPRYRGVVAHITYLPGRVEKGLLPPGCLEISLQAPLAGNPCFSFDVIDVAAYPYGQRSQPAPCSTVLSRWPHEAKLQLLDAAGEERLRRKAERMAMAIVEEGADQVLYAEVMTALGYKHNKALFRSLAERLGHDDLHAGPAGEAAYALLTGVAGLLPHDASPRWDRPTRTFVRTLWDTWWRQQAAWSSRLMDRGAWRLSGQRPANHPLRRLMAAALLFARPESPATRWLSLLERRPRHILSEIEHELTSLSHPYWDRRLALGGKTQSRRVALVGPARARAIILNVVVPWLAARDPDGFAKAQIMDQLPADSDNSLARQAAFFLFGPAHPVSLYRSGLRRQGLLQIFHDFCINDRTRCEACPFPSMLDLSRNRTMDR